MARLYILGTAGKAQMILDWLDRESSVSSRDVTAIVEYSKPRGDAETHLSGVPLESWDSIRDTVDHNDFFIVTGERFREAVAELFSLGLFHVFDGETIISRESTSQKLFGIGADLYLGPNVPAGLEPDHDDFLRYTAEPLEVTHMPGDKLFIVNSLPKSGTVWMMAMLEGLLKVKSKQQITASHVFDIRSDWRRRNNHGAVVLVRDMRDVVVSWFHDLARTDLLNGFSSPRYGDLQSFYFEHLLGQVFANPRYAFGKLEEWLDFVAKKSFPIVRYEDLVADTESGLRKVTNFWKIRVSDESLRAVARDYSFENMRATVSGQGGFIAGMVKRGHMRKGAVGSWKEELPEAIAQDVSQRFVAYQRRLRY